MTPEELTARADECQAAYLVWAKANPENALAGLDRRNRWLKRNGRARHAIEADTIAAL